MAPFAQDPRRIAMTRVLLPLLSASCPPDAGGYGGSVELRLPDEEADELGGIPLLRAALRAAGRELGWRTETYGAAGTIHGTMAGVADRRTVPEPFAGEVEADRARQLRAAVDRVGRPGRPTPTEPGCLATHQPTQAFRTAYAEARASTSPAE